MSRQNPIDSLSSAQRACLPDVVAFLEDVGAFIVTPVPGTDEVTLQPTPELLTLIKKHGLATAVTMIQSLNETTHDTFNGRPRGRARGGPQGQR